MGKIVVDIGGTNLRAALFKNGELTDIVRTPVYNFQNSKLTGDALYQTFLNQLTSLLDSLLFKYPSSEVAIAFPGPVNDNGIALSAPTLLGDFVNPISIQADCERRFGRRVTVTNDITAATWRYVEQQQDNFGLFTISSGVGNKVFYNNQVLISKQGLGGEIGHCQTPMANSVACDCGGQGHIGSISSGRGVIKLCQHTALEKATEFEQSQLHKLCHGDITSLTTHHFVSAVKNGDLFSTDVLAQSQMPIVDAMQHLYHSIGVHRFVFIGGFCLALGQHYLNQLIDEVKRRDWFHLPQLAIDNMCVLGSNDDDHSLIGLGFMPTMERL